MARNMVQFQKGLSMVELLKNYGTEEACWNAIVQLHWPSSFRYPKSGNSTCCELKSHKVFQCHRCYHQTSLTAGSIFDRGKPPLSIWFLAIFLLPHSKTRMSAMALSRHLSVQYNTAWLLKQKLMQTMREHDDSKPLTGPVQIDDAYWGGERQVGKRGPGADGKTPFVAAVACSTDGRPLAMRMMPAAGFRSDSIGRWANTHLAPEAEVTSDGLHCFRAIVETCSHWSITTGGAPTSIENPEFTWVNTMLGNVKKALHGTYHAVRKKHIGHSLGAFSYWFNRRFVLGSMIERLAYVACLMAPLPYRLVTMAEVHA